MRRYRTPIWRDVKQGTPSGLAGGRFVMNDGESAQDFGALLIDDSGNNFLLQTDDGAKILID